MSHSAISRVSLADLICEIGKADCTERTRQEMMSAIRTVARVLDADPSAIPLHVQFLRKRLEGVAPRVHGLSPGRWANVRSLLGKALALAVPVLPGRSLQPLSTEWQLLLDAAPRSRSICLRPLLRFLSERKIEPNGVQASDLDAYKDALMCDRLRNRTDATWDRVSWSWNSCTGSVPGWPAFRIERQIRRTIHVLSWDAFPQSLRTDVEKYLRRLAGADLTEDGPSRPMRPATLSRRRHQLRLSASALVHRGIDPQSITGIATLTKFENFQEILRYFLERNGSKSSPQIGQLSEFLKNVARHWSGVDSETLARMRAVTGRLSSPRSGMTERNRSRLRPLDDPETVAIFLDLPHRIRQELAKDRRAPRIKAVVAQMAAAIALLQAAPIRAKNLASLDLHRHLIERGRHLHLLIPGEETKNREPIEFELPPHATELIAWYVREHRTFLIDCPSSALFPGRHGAPKKPATLSFQVTRAVRRYTGLAINVHLFRHAGGKIYLDARPGEYEVVRRVLGHASIATTTRAYTGAETKAAGRHFAEVIE